MNEKPHRLLITLPKYHVNLLKDINKSEGISYAEIMRLGLVDFHTKVQIKNNPNPFKVMHGKQFKEPQTTKDCYTVDCNDCAYQSPCIPEQGSCPHYDNMLDAEAEK